MQLLHVTLISSQPNTFLLTTHIFPRIDTHIPEQQEERVPPRVLSVVTQSDSTKREAKRHEKLGTEDFLFHHRML